MIKGRLTVAFLLAFVLILIFPFVGHSQESFKVLLRHAYPIGMCATNEIAVQMKGTIKMEKGEPFLYDASITLVMLLKVEEVANDGIAKLSMRVSMMASRQTLGPETQNMIVTPGFMSVDDEMIWDRRNNPGPHPMQEIFGSRVFVKINPRGQVTDFTSLQELSKLNPNVDIPSQVANGSVVFPEEAVVLGQSWEDKNTVLLNPNAKPVPSLSKYTLEKIEPDPATGSPIAVISVVRSADVAKINVGSDKNQPAPGDTEEVKVQNLKINKMQQNFSGKLYFDVTKGRITKTEQTGKHYVDSSAELLYGEEKISQNSVADLQLTISTRILYEN